MSDYKDNLPKKTWIVDGINGEAIEYADREGKAIAGGNFSRSQFRNFYGELKRIQLKGIGQATSSFHLLKPKLAYAANRNGKDGAKRFKEIMNKAMEFVAVDDVSDTEAREKRFQNFCDFVEAILAYHRVYEKGKKKEKNY